MISNLTVFFLAIWITSLAYEVNAKTLVNLSVGKSKGKFNHDIHERLTANELHSIFGTNDPSKLPVYDITYPYLVDHNASRTAQAQRSLHDSIPMFLHFKAFDQDFHLSITRNRVAVPENQIIEHHTQHGIQRLKGKAITVSTGKVVQDPDSIVTLDHSAGLRGMISRGGEIYVIAKIPRNDESNSLDSHGAHIIFKKSDVPASHPQNHHSCGAKSFKNVLPKRSFGNDDVVRQRKRRSVTKKPEKFMELMIVADKTMLAHYQKDFLLTYMLAQANMVAGMYLDPSMEYPITVVVTRVVMLDTDALANATTLYDLLRKFRDWANEHNPLSEDDPLHVDMTALFTKNGCKNGCLINGIAFVGICGRNTMHSVTVDRGLMSAITVAHEIGHSLGLNHDGIEESVNCSDNRNIMATGQISGKDGHKWSKCSSDFIKHQLESKASSCLDDKPMSNPFPMNVSFQLYGTIYNGTKQCQLRYGPNSTHCEYLAKEFCHNLRCWVSGTCPNAVVPPAHGTWCNKHKWCIHGHCVPDGTTPEPPIDGGWSEYGEYTTCNRPCGGGVQWRERSCNNPAPKNGGKKCVGESKGLWKTCNMQACAAGTPSFRTEQCQAFGKDKYYVMDYYSPCKLVCKSPTAASAWYHNNVKDGTLADSVGPDICINGVRRSVGCDLILESGTIIDRCRVCGGDGSTCALVKFKNMNPYPYSGDYEIGVVPAGSINVVVEEMQPTYDFLNVKPGTSNQYCFGIPTWSTTAQCAGSSLKYTMNEFAYKDKIEITGPITEQARIYYINYYGPSSKGVEWNYYVATEGNTSTLEYAVGVWGKCSKSCAGGIQTRKIICRRTDDKTAVSPALCSAFKKANTTQDCNTTPCPAIWHITPWTPCSRTCGNGTKTRFLNCSQLHSDNKYHLATDTSTCTAATKPLITLKKHCNTVMCHAEWVAGEWGACNTTCDLGYKTKQLYCKRRNADGSVITVSNLECYKLTKPVITAECNTDILCPQWVSLYRACTKTCGGGLQYSYTECRRPGSEVKVDDSLCKAELKPSQTVKPCNTDACDSYHWKSVEGTCSASCGNGIITVNVTCHRVRDNATVADELCLNSTKPATTKPCNSGICPDVFTWTIVKGICSVTCGQGTAKDTISCIRQRDSAKVLDTYCEPSFKPSVGPPVKCTMKACPETYSWSVTYGICSVTCATGVKQPIVNCVKDSDKTTVAASFCTAVKPVPGTLACNMGQCPPTYLWKMFWGKCSVVCGTGSKTSYYKCYLGATDTEMDISFCGGIVKPKTTTTQCSMPACIYHWEPTYGECLVSCGSGYKILTVNCKDNNGTDAPNSNCAEEKAAYPAQQQCTGLSPCVAAGPKSSTAPKYFGLGCFRDEPGNRRLPFQIANYRSSINWNDMSLTVDKCATEVDRRNKASVNPTSYEFFSIQFYGECWVGESSSAKTYFTFRSSTDCYMGTGGSGVNYVYHFGSNIQTTQLAPIRAMGCFNDNLSSPRPLPVFVDSFRSGIDWKKPWSETVATVVRKCALATAKRGYTMFGIQYDAECWSGPNVNSTYNEDGSSTACKSGVGGINSYYVYDFA